MQTLEERFWGKVRKGAKCWEWQAALNSSGYGAFSIRRRWHGAHRVAYELVNGPIPPQLTINHICKNRRCVRPDHLDLMTEAENKGWEREKAHCPQGHPYSEENIYYWRGWRKCRTCVLERAKKKQKENYKPRTLVLGCRRGHFFTPENTAYYRGQRICRACGRLRTQKARANRQGCRSTTQIVGAPTRTECR